MRRKRTAAKGLALLVVVGIPMTLSACGGRNDRPVVRRSGSSSPTVPMTNGSVDAERSQAAAVYRVMWADFAEAAVDSDYRSPALSRRLAGDALSLVMQALYTNRRLGIVVRGEPVPAMDLEVTVVPGGEPTVEVVDCLDATNWLEVRADTGALKDDLPGGRHATNATLTLADGTWKVTRLVIGGVGTC